MSEKLYIMEGGAGAGRYIFLIVSSVWHHDSRFLLLNEQCT